jgi:K(+)-stimulated pyrophosphate-energized sodium pump
MNMLWNRFSRWCLVPAWMMLILSAPMAGQSQGHKPGGEASLVLPDVSQAEMMGLSGTALLGGGLLVCALGLLFGLAIYL